MGEVNRTVTHVILPSQVDGSEVSVPANYVRDRYDRLKMKQLIRDLRFQHWSERFRREDEAIRRTS